MKPITPTSLFLILSMITFVSSCKKDQVELIPMAGIKIVNAVTGGTTARLNAQTTSISNNNSGNFVLPVGNPDIYVYPVGDSSNPYYNANKAIAVSANEYYSLFIGGTTGNTTGLLVKDSWQNYTDSVMGIRFVNLSPNSTPLNLTLSTSTSTNQFANISYQGVTDFIQLPATKNITTYTFQVRAAANPNTVISSMSISLSGTSAIPRFKNVTLVFKGNVGGTGSLAPFIIRVNHY